MPGLTTMPKTQSQRGFTIIELMIVMMIIGILVALVLPNMRVNAVRARVSEAILALNSCKTMVSEVYLSGSDLPGAGNWGCEVAAGSGGSQYVKAIKTTDEGIIIVELQGDPKLNLFEIALAPLDDTGNVPTVTGSPIRSWRCGKASDLTPPVSSPTWALNQTFLPGSCRGL
jgi:prepilin-type N-terminal cleavage/methylation domain-containing protein